MKNITNVTELKEKFEWFETLTVNEWNSNADELYKMFNSASYYIRKVYENVAWPEWINVRVKIDDDAYLESIDELIVVQERLLSKIVEHNRELYELLWQ